MYVVHLLPINIGYLKINWKNSEVGLTNKAQASRFNNKLFQMLIDRYPDYFKNIKQSKLEYIVGRGELVYGKQRN